MLLVSPTFLLLIWWVIYIQGWMLSFMSRKVETTLEQCAINKVIWSFLSQSVKDPVIHHVRNVTVDGWPLKTSWSKAISHHYLPFSSCRSKQPEPAIHPWVLPEKPCNFLQLNHVINFTGHNYLVLTDAYSKYLWIPPAYWIPAKVATNLLEQDFACSGYHISW